MTTDHARDIAAELQQRADAMGDRTGEGVYLGRAASTILSLCSEIEQLSARDVPPPEDAVHVGEDASEPINATEPKKRGRPRKVADDAE